MLVKKKWKWRNKNKKMKKKSQSALLKVVFANIKGSHVRSISTQLGALIFAKTPSTVSLQMGSRNCRILELAIDVCGG